MRPNRTKDKLKRGETVFGCAIQHFRSIEVGRIFAAAGFDFLFIDCEHTGFDLETVHDVIAAAAHVGITPIVRPAELLYSLIARVMDIGAQGIILPRVDEPRLLEEAVSWMRFPPLGKRGFGMMPPVLDYQPHSMAEIVEQANAGALIITQFETQAALDRADELLSIPGIDVAMVGPADLSIALGVPGQFEHPTLRTAVTRLMEVCERRGVATGIHFRDARLSKPWAERGMRFVSVGSELTLLMDKANETVAMMHR